MLKGRARSRKLTDQYTLAQVLPVKKWFFLQTQMYIMPLTPSITLTSFYVPRNPMKVILREEFKRKI
ncbi:hypothetical protein NQ318_000757 [Aromia moschata]|uniref:Uncharacterized protein n=1 Tax=Aromia moschata TaxID=1265417 RepID=A0AAV8YRZ7_9CUCU|nr:hypothetical protein NQ318_000757 [Aromia moschata]